jgi:hypothetical protein
MQISCGLPDVDKTRASDGLYEDRQGPKGQWEGDGRKGGTMGGGWAQGDYSGISGMFPPELRYR